MDEQKATFVSPLQSTTRKTSTEQKSSLCLAHKDTGEFPISIHLKVVWLEHVESGERKDQWK